MTHHSPELNSSLTKRSNSIVISKDFLEKPVVLEHSYQSKIIYPNFLSEANLEEKNKHLENMNLYYRDIISHIQNSKTEFQQVKLLIQQLDLMSKEMTNLKSKNEFLEKQIYHLKPN